MKDTKAFGQHLQKFYVKISRKKMYKWEGKDYEKYLSIWPASSQV